MRTGSTTENGEKKSLRKSGQTGTFWPVAGRPPFPYLRWHLAPRAEPPFPYLRWLGSQLIGGAALDGPPRRLFQAASARHRSPAAYRLCEASALGPNRSSSGAFVVPNPPTSHTGSPRQVVTRTTARRKWQNARQHARMATRQRSPIAALSCVSAINRPERKKALKIARAVMRFGRKPGALVRFGHRRGRSRAFGSHRRGAGRRPHRPRPPASAPLGPTTARSIGRSPSLDASSAGRQARRGHDERRVRAKALDANPDPYPAPDAASTRS